MASDENTPANGDDPSDVVVLIHGIRDHALWQSSIRECLENSGFTVELTNYERFDVIRFLLPFQYFRNKVIDRISSQVEQINVLHTGKKISFVAHSFGTLIITEIMRRRFNFRAHRIILCGSVVKYDFPFEQVGERFVLPVLNEVGTRDIWPAIAQSITTGYGAAGSFGFRRPHVRDRWHDKATHGTFLTSKFCRKYWVPFLKSGRIVEAEQDPQSPSLGIRLLSIFRAKYLLLTALCFAMIWFKPWETFERSRIEAWVASVSELVEGDGLDPSLPIPNDVRQHRAQFESWWQNSGIDERRKFDPELIYKALSRNSNLYRAYERTDDLKPNATYWNNQCVEYFVQIQHSNLTVECLLDSAALYLDLSQINHTDSTVFKQVAEDGKALMTRAVAIATGDQKAVAARISSRFYYNLARPKEGLLSQPWNNDYLALALREAKLAYDTQPAEIKNITQYSRCVQRMAANPPQDQMLKWTANLREVQEKMTRIYADNRETLKTPHKLIPPANVLAVLTMDLANREWREAKNNRSIAAQSLRMLNDNAIPTQGEVLAMLSQTEWEKDYAFDINYDLGRMRLLAVQILDSTGDPQADVMFRQALDSLNKAATAASRAQTQSAITSLHNDMIFAELRSDRTQLVRESMAIN